MHRVDLLSFMLAGAGVLTLIPESVQAFAPELMMGKTLAGTALEHLDYAAFVFERARESGWPLALEALEPIASADYPTAAPRPANSRLDTTRLATTFGLRLPPWQDEVARTVAVLAEPLSLLPH